MTETLASDLPQDRRQALATGSELPARTHGAALFADIAGFTPLTEALDRALGARRGAEEMTRQINRFAWLHGAYPVLGQPEPLKADLVELARLDITPLDTPEPKLAYLFKHIVTQEVAYASLTEEALATLHEQLAAYLEQLAGDETDRYVDLLAYHYERSDNLAKKRHYLQRARSARSPRIKEPMPAHGRIMNRSYASPARWGIG